MTNKALRPSMSEESFRMFEPFMLSVIESGTPLIVDPQVCFEGKPMQPSTFRSRFNEARLGYLTYGFESAGGLQIARCMCFALSDGTCEISLKGNARHSAPQSHTLPSPVLLSDALNSEQSAFLASLKSTPSEQGEEKEKV